MKDKICLICHLAIDTSKEFCEFKHYKDKDNIRTKAFYHVNCFRDRMSGAPIQKALAEKTMAILNKVGGRIE